MIEFTAPIRIESEANRSAGRHYQVRRRRFVAQDRDIAMIWRAHRNAKREATSAELLALHAKGSRIVVTFTRIAPRSLDTDNLASGFKHVRDFVARDILGRNDGDPTIRWEYANERGGVREYAARVRIEVDRGIVYLASPYSSSDPAVRAARFVLANKAAGALMKRGHIVYSPISHSHSIAESCALPLGWEYWEATDRAFLSVSRLLIVLCIDGWRESAGVQAEITIAKELGLPIEYVTLEELEIVVNE